MLSGVYGSKGPPLGIPRKALGAPLGIPGAPLGDPLGDPLGKPEGFPKGFLLGFPPHWPLWATFDLWTHNAPAGPKNKNSEGNPWGVHLVSPGPQEAPNMSQRSPRRPRGGISGFPGVSVFVTRTTLSIYLKKRPTYYYSNLQLRLLLLVLLRLHTRLLRLLPPQVRRRLLQLQQQLLLIINATITATTITVLWVGGEGSGGQQPPRGVCGLVCYPCILDHPYQGGSARASGACVSEAPSS